MIVYHATGDPQAKSTSTLPTLVAEIRDMYYELESKNNVAIDHTYRF